MSGESNSKNEIMKLFDYYFDGSLPYRIEQPSKDLVIAIYSQCKTKHGLDLIGSPLFNLLLG